MSMMENILSIIRSEEWWFLYGDCFKFDDEKIVISFELILMLFFFILDECK